MLSCQERAICAAAAQERALQATQRPPAPFSRSPEVAVGWEGLEQEYGSRNTGATGRAFRLSCEVLSSELRGRRQCGDNGEHWSSDGLILQDFELLPLPATVSSQHTYSYRSSFLC